MLWLPTTTPNCWQAHRSHKNKIQDLFSQSRNSQTGPQIHFSLSNTNWNFSFPHTSLLTQLNLEEFQKQQPFQLMELKLYQVTWCSAFHCDCVSIKLLRVTTGFQNYVFLHVKSVHRSLLRIFVNNEM